MNEPVQSLGRHSSGGPGNELSAVKRAGLVLLRRRGDSGQGKQQKQQGLRAHSDSSFPGKPFPGVVGNIEPCGVSKVGHEGNGPSACRAVAVGKVDVSG